MNLLDIDSLTLELPNGTRLLDGISITVAKGETVGLVGESGSGKSLTARSVLGLLPERATMGGQVLLEGEDSLRVSQQRLSELRRHSASMVFQDPRAGINPMRTVGEHLTETLRLCEHLPAEQARQRGIEMLKAVRLPRPEQHLKQYPHEFSGGMLQRVMIAGALISSPKLLICDEPTTALDVTTQAEIIAVLTEQAKSRGMGMLFITHDLNLAASLCDRVYVMSQGRVVEQGSAQGVFSAPQAEYTRKLVAATPTVAVDPAAEVAAARPVAVAATADRAGALRARAVSKTYTIRGQAPVRAVQDVSLEVSKGAALGVVGESGSGKSTLARIVVGLESADAGEILIAGKERTKAPRRRAERLAHARSAQMVFQDPYLSLDPRITAGHAIEDALKLHSKLSTLDSRNRVLELLDQVGMTGKHAQARPRTLSGGQRQCVAIARALAIEPDLLVMDEATSALDVSVQAQVLDVVAEIRRERGLTVLFISHDLAVVRRVCEETVVMRHGEIVEHGRTLELLGNPQHPYTRLLLDSVPRPAWNREVAVQSAT
ncbi:dipeptide ABC transporter ATP-binding protein [Arthrobacter sp. HY1533]|uniref:dipeptide ABC transporter ATP-binding protein n=1 Tax=Arthrobacter sp. HY1533 TaxID=2970919 RepID=UPI0022B9D5CF|nr:ABC transporter ATP-binding protein [Arthrobacter sp. HY1533]